MSVWVLTLAILVCAADQAFNGIGRVEVCGRRSIVCSCSTMPGA